MPIRFSSPLNDLANDPDADRKVAEASRNFRRNIKTRDGKVWFAEACIFLTAAGTVVWMGIDFARTGSKQSLFMFVLIGLMGWWPFLRHRLLRGDWPNDYR